jgi:hypothetical protein
MTKLIDAFRNFAKAPSKTIASPSSRTVHLKFWKSATYTRFDLLSDIHQDLYKNSFILFGATAPSGPGPLNSRGFWSTHNDAPLDEWSALRRDLHLTAHNTHNRQTSMPRWDSNPQSQLASGRSPTPWTARPLGLTCIWIEKVNFKIIITNYFNWDLSCYKNSNNNNNNNISV